MQNTARAFFRSVKRKGVGLANNGAGIWQGELAGKLMDDIIVSGCFRSDTGADAFHALHSIADTAWKNGQSPLDAIMALV